MKAKAHQLLTHLSDTPILIWGARMTGLGLVRWCRSHDISILGFIDSDPAFNGKTLSGLPCHPPTEIPHLLASHPGLRVIVAASTKEIEINALLLNAGFPQDGFVNYSTYCDLFYTVDVMGTCNLKCQSCAHGAGGEKFTRGLMPLETFKQVIDKIVAENDLVTHISLYSWGEPFLHPALPEMVAYLHQHDIAAALSSNLSIKNEALLRKVLLQNPEYLKVSLSGYYPDAYNQTHQGGDIYLVRSNMLRLKHYLDKYKLDTVIDVNYHLYNNNNQRNLQKMAELCDELGFSLSETYALVMPLERVIEKLEGRPSPSTLALESKLLVTVEEGISASRSTTSSETPCPFLENQTIVNWDLSVPVCCTTFNRDTNIVASNFLETPLAAIHQNKQKASICATCSQLGLPAYNLGLNHRQWESIAGQKPSSDLPRI
jgi:wyosine [tRNA(Phe)-imidazoG37] synthetase (radical SAM superfamily)